MRRLGHLFQFLIFIAALLIPASAAAQYARFDFPEYTINQSAPIPGGMYPMLAFPGVTVQLCSSWNSSACTALLQTYLTAAGTACPTSTQLVSPQPGSTCSAATDDTGDVGGFALPGNYAYFVTTAQGTFGPYQFAVSTGGAYCAINFCNNVYYPATASQLVADVAVCGSVSPCTVSVNTGITLTANLTLTPNITLLFVAPGAISVSTFTLTVNGPVIAPTVQVFFPGSGTITLGPQSSSQVPFEWFGAVGSTTLPATDSTTAMQACLTAITNGQCVLQPLIYKTSSALSITKSNVGIRGSATGFPSPTLYPNPNPSMIETTSASADVIDVLGTSNSNTIAFNNFQNFTTARSVAPSGGTDRGLSLIYVDGAIVDGVWNEDDLAGIYIHGMASQGVGRIDNSGAIWGYNGFAETSGSMAGIYVDSTSGINNNSLRIRNGGAFSALSYSTGAAYRTYGFYMTGSALHDLHSFHFETAGTDYGDYLLSTGGSSLDVFLSEPVNDSCNITCLSINTGSTADVQIVGGWSYGSGNTTAPAPCVDIESSSHVALTTHMVIIGNCTVGILADLSGGIKLIGNDFLQTGSANVGAISFTGTLSSIITGNILNGPQNWGTSAINLSSGSSYNVVSDNSVEGTATNGIFIDSTSLGIAGLETNMIGAAAFGTITNPINDASGNGTTIATAYANRQTVTITPLTAAGSGATATCSTGMTCSPQYGVINLVAGTGPSSGDIVSVTWGIPNNHKAIGLAQTYDNTAAAVVTSIFSDGGAATTSKCTFYSTAALTNTHQYSIIYACN